MKKIFAIILFFVSGFTFAQFKGEAEKPINISEGILSENPISSLFSFIDPSKFSMNHSLSLSYSSFGSGGMTLGIYTNKIAYEFSNKLNMEIETSLVNTPYNSFGDAFTKSINGIYINNARLNYRPTENTLFSIQFSNSPFGRYNRYSNYGYGFNSFNNFWYDD